MGRGSGVVVIHFGVGVLAFLGQMGREVVMMMTVMTHLGLAGFHKELFGHTFLI